MENEKQQIIVAENLVAGKIYYIRDRRVILDRDLAELYEVETKVLNQSVRRNIERFPDAFMFQLNSSEFEILKSQIVTSSWGGTRKLPFAFTEQGVAMLSSVLRSKKDPSEVFQTIYGIFQRTKIIHWFYFNGREVNYISPKR